MPATTSSQPLLASYPNFMSVFGGEGVGRHSNEQITTASNASSAATKSLPQPPSSNVVQVAGLAANSAGADIRRDSSATHRSDSTDSSPTTTISTLDSTLTDPSPSSSPESPGTHNSSLPAANFHTMKSFNPHARDAKADSPLDSSQNSSLDASPVRPGGERGEGSGKRARNAKNLSINTTGINTKQATSSKLATSSLADVAESSTSSLPAVAEPQNAPTAVPGHVLPDGPGGNTNHAFSAPASPSAMLPSIPPPRKSRLGLTITTTDPESFERSGAVPSTPSRPFPMSLRTRGSDLGSRLGMVPETPGLPPLSSMRETQETGEALFSPSMAPRGGMQLPPFRSTIDPTLPTPGFGPQGGMQLPQRGGSNASSPAARTSRPALNLPRSTFDAPSSSSVVQHTISHKPQTPQHELPLSREAKSPGYPDGPVCIYPPGVFLYHQPTREEARAFDVIINVAKEVENPFLAAEEDTAPAEPAFPEPRYRDAGVQCTILPGEPEPLRVSETPVEPSSAVSDKTFISAFERLPDDEPETPKAAAPPKKLDPEYIHLPWEHNSKVYDEWLRVCETIDDRVRRGQRVLIHCQLGVSRSASLVVAYGIYKNPRLTPDEAREQAKRRSRWIDLNMHFMYELGDFRKLLADRSPEAAAAQAAPQHAMRRQAHGPNPLSRTKTDSFLAGGSHAIDTQPSVEDRGPPRIEDLSGRRASTPNQIEQRFDARLDTLGDEPASAPIRASWSPTSMTPDAENGHCVAAPAQEPLSQSEPAKDDSRQNTPRPFPLRTEHPEDAPPLPLPPSRPAPPPPIDSSIAQSHDLPAQPRTAEKKDIKPIPIQPPDSTSHRSADELHTGHVSVENAARDTDSLPPPNLSLPPAPPNGTNSPKPRRSLRPMPSLPAGFNSTIRSRRLLLQPSSPSPPPAVPPLPLHLQMLGAGGTAAANAGSTATGDAAQPEWETLMSPRAAEFTANPFHARQHRSSAGDLALAGLSAAGCGKRAVEEDPRSPHALGREPVVRSIDDILD